MGLEVVFDFESLGLNEDSVLLSMGMIAFDPLDEKYNLKKYDIDTVFQNLVNDGIYFKFNVKEQIEKWDRKITKDTLHWWKEQGDEALSVLKPSSLDVSFEHVEFKINSYLKDKNFHKNTNVWSRGYVDCMWYESIKKHLNTVGTIQNYWQYKEIRTFLSTMVGEENLFYNSTKNLKMPKKFIKHHSLHDSCFDAIQMMIASEF